MSKSLSTRTTKKHHSSALLALCSGNPPVNCYRWFQHKWPVKRKVPTGTFSVIERSLWSKNAILSKSPKSWNIWLRPSPLFWQNLPKFIKMSHGFFKELFISKHNAKLVIRNSLRLRWEIKFCIDSLDETHTGHREWLPLHLHLRIGTTLSPLLCL